MIKLAFVHMVVAMLIMSCSTSSSTSNTLIDPSCLQGHWYYFDQEVFTQDTMYHEFIFLQDRLMIFTENIGQVAGDYYRLNGDTLIFGDASSLVKYDILSCSDAKLILVNINQQTDTLSLKPYDTGYWNAHITQIPVWISEHHQYGLGDEVDRAFAMRLKEGMISFDDLDSIPDFEIEYFEEVEPVLKEQQK